MTLKHWIACCECGGFVNSDGFGNLATETEMSDEEVKPSMVTKGTLNTSFTHVVWFNR